LAVLFATCQHFLQQRRALPFNLTAILKAQLTRSTDHSSTDQPSGHSATEGCDRHACYQLDPATRCSTECCRHSACCPPTVFVPVLYLWHAKYEMWNIYASLFTI